MYLVSLRISDGFRSGREKSVVVFVEKNSNWREDGSASSGSASSASKTSSMSDVSFSRGAKEERKHIN